MFKKLFKKESKKSSLYKVVYNWSGCNEKIEIFATSAGLASLECDPLVQVVEVVKI